MATITNFPVSTACMHTQRSQKIAPVSAVGNYEVSAHHCTVCKICGCVILDSVESCPKCKNMIFLSRQPTGTQAILSYMDTLRSALKNADVPVSTGYDMALAA